MKRVSNALAGKSVNYCVLIPSRGRPDILAKTFRKMPFLDDDTTYIGLENKEREDYARAMPPLKKATVILYDNPAGSVAVAREVLRKTAVAVRKFDYAVVTDDNAVYTEQSLQNLVGATCLYHRTLQKMCIMAGMHNTAPHFDRNLIAKKMKVGGYVSYPNVAMIFQCYPMALYQGYSYPPDAYGLDDRHFYLSMIARGVRDFRVCMDAPFNKSRYQAGGQGPIEQRMEKCGKAIARLAQDFPRFVGATGTLRIPWQFILSMESGDMTADRLVGGSMRKEASLTVKKLKIRRRA